MALEADQVGVGQDQVLLLLAEHGAAGLDLAMLQDVAAVGVVDGEVEAQGGAGRGGRERLVVVELGAAQGAKHGARALALASIGQLRSWASRRDRRLRNGVLVNRVLLAVRGHVGQAGHEGRGAALAQQIGRLRLIFLGGDARECAERAAEDAPPFVLGHGARLSCVLLAGAAPRELSGGNGACGGPRAAGEQSVRALGRQRRGWAMPLRKVAMGGQLRRKLLLLETSPRCQWTRSPSPRCSARQRRRLHDAVRYSVSVSTMTVRYGQVSLQTTVLGQWHCRAQKLAERPTWAGVTIHRPGSTGAHFTAACNRERTTGGGSTASSMPSQA